MTGDARGWRIALVASSLLNPPQQAKAALREATNALEASGYGVLQLPPPGEHRLLLAVIADQVAEYTHHGYAVVAVGLRGEAADGLHWRQMAPLLRHRGTALPPRHMVRVDGDATLERGRLAEFLAAYDLPLEVQRRWRV